MPDRLVTKQRQADDQPDHALGQQAAAAQGHCSGLAPDFVYRGWIDQAGETLEPMRRRVSRIVQVELESNKKTDSWLNMNPF
jgi:hypothetical protein